MVWRVLRFLAGAGVAGGGGYLVWTHRGEASALYPFVMETAPWWLIGGLGMLVLGMVSLISSLLPSASSHKRAEKAARHEAHLRDADTFYAQRARAVERDWRAGDLPPEPAPAAPPPPEPSVPPQPAQAGEAAAISPSAALPSEPPAKAETQAVRPAAPPAAASAIARPAAPSAATTPAPCPFPATQTLSALPSAASLLADPLPPHLPKSAGAQPPAASPAPLEAARSQTPPPAESAPQAAPPSALPAKAPNPAPAPASSPLEAIRTAIAASRLDEADRMLSLERTRLSSDEPDSLALAELTGLAGDHAAAAGRLGGAKWLWRLSLQRFAAANAIASPAARAVSERLRLADQ